MGNLSEEVSIVIISSAFFLLVAVGIVILVLVYQKKQNLYLQEKAALEAAFEREMLEAKLEMQEQTLKFVAQEIHDNIGQTLSLVKLNLHTLRPEKENAAEKIGTTKELVGKAITDLRSLSKTMHTEAVLSAGLADAISMELQLIGRTDAFVTKLTITGTPIPVEPQKELILFRAVQEALNNAIKHSGATLIEVHLCYTPQAMQVTVKDNGSGLIQGGQAKPEGLGMRNLRNRAKLIGGHVTIEGLQSGTQIQLNLPIIAA